MDIKMPMQVPEPVRELAEKTVDQAEKAFDAFLNAANQSVGMVPGPATDISKQTLSFTDQNMKAAFEHARKLLHATDLQHVMQIQGEYIKNQFATAQDQMKQLSIELNSAAKGVSGSTDTQKP